MLETRAALARSQEELLRSHRLLDAIAEIQSLFIRDARPRELFDAVLATLLRITDSGYGFVGEVLHDGTGAPYLRTFSLTNIAWDEATRALYAKYEQEGLEFRNLDTLFGLSLRSGETVISNDPARDPRHGGLPERHPPLETYLGLPVAAGGRMVGLIGLANRPGGYDQALVEYLTPLLQTCGQIIEAFRNERERRAALEALRQSETRYKAVLDTAADAIVTIDEGGIIEDFNPAAERIFGYTRDAVVGANVSVLMASPHREAHDGYLANYLRTGNAKIIGIGREVTGRRQNGELFPMELAIAEMILGGRRHFSGIVRDITERKRGEAQLTRLTVELQAIFDLSPDGFVAFGEDGRLSYANPAFRKMCGCASTELVGMSLADFDAMLAGMCDGDRPYVPIATAAASGYDILTRARPRLTIVRRSVRTLRDDAGQELGRVAYFQDITRESELDRMKTEFLATAAHELRTPMASIHGYSELLLKREFDAETRRDMVQTIHRQSSNLVRLVNELLDLARIEARAGKDFRIQAQPLAPIVTAAVSHLMPEDPRQVVLRLDADLPPVLADADKLEQALLNVLSNAYKYSPDGGAIELETRSRVRDARRELGIAIRDRGIGMAPEQVERVFERFYRADTSGAIPGTGLGMSLVKEIMDIHQGEVEITSTPKRGTEVVLWLPTSPATPPSV